MTEWKSAVTVVNSGTNALAQFYDPSGDEPYTYPDPAHGFALTQALLDNAKPVTAQVGPEEWIAAADNRPTVCLRSWHE